MIYKEYKILDIFDIGKGRTKYTNSFIKNNLGIYPVYSSQTVNDGIIGFINTYDYDCHCITWTTDGIHAGTIFIRNGKFSMSSHCGALIPKKEGIKIDYNKIYIEYIYAFLSKNLKNYAIGDQNKRLTTAIIKNVKIKIPITSTHEFDIQKQKEIVEKFNIIKDVRRKIIEYKHKIKMTNVNVDGTGFLNRTIDPTIKELFDLSIKTNNSKFTKSFIEMHKGNIPVYSASKDECAVDYGYVKNNIIGVKYFEDCFTWNIDGSIGKIFFRKGRFSLSEKVIPLVLQDKYKNCDKLYLKYTIENVLSIKSFGFTNKAGKGKIQNIRIKIPITATGEFDIQEQKEIANKYSKIEEIKKNIKAELEKIENAEIDIGFNNLSSNLNTA